MEKYLADSSAWIASFAKTGHEALKEAMKEKIMAGKLVTTGMVLLELLRGTRNEASYQTLLKQMSILPFLSVNDSIWTQVAKLSLSLKAKGVQTSVPDIFIAQVAIEHDCQLVHCDRDFEQIAKYTSLKTMAFV